jgi:hypothetical protein
VTTLTQIPADKQLVGRSPTWTIRVEAIAPSSAPLSRTLSVFRAGTGVIYTAVNGVTTFIHPAFVESVTYSGVLLEVQLQLVAAAAQGEEFSFTTTYTDSAPTNLSVIRQHLAGDVLVLAQSPRPAELDVAPTSPILFTLSSAAPLNIESAKITVDGVIAYDAPSGFTRPDFFGRVLLSPTLLTTNVSGRRHFRDDEPVDVDVEVRFKSAGVLVAKRSYSWAFNPAFLQTTTFDASLQVTALDIPSPRGLIETFRQALLAALRPPRSTASFAVLLFYAVQASGLASIAGYLPSASRLQREVSRLHAGDLASPEVAHAHILPVVPLFEIFLREVVTMRQALPEEAELLLRAWETGDASNRLAAASAALLYAIPPTE